MKIRLIIPGLLLLLLACTKDSNTDPGPVDSYRDDMRNFVIGISEKAKAAHPGFAVVPQNGIELITANGEALGDPVIAYLAAIDGHGQEDLFYGYASDDTPTLPNETAYLTDFLDLSQANGNTILVTDYCATPAKMDDSYAQNHSRGYISFAADHRELDHIPDYPTPIFNENTSNIASLPDAQNFLYLINPSAFANRQQFVDNLAATDYDLLIIDLFGPDGVALTAQQVAQLKTKACGGNRLVICYMSIGEAEDYRYYWQPGWNTDPPSWLAAENPDWPGNYKVRYWDPAWQQIIFTGSDSYLDRILTAGFDGVYLDIIDGFEYFE